MAKGFVYRGNQRTAETIQRKAQEGSRSYDSFIVSGIPQFKPREGENCIRILPSAVPEEPDWDLVIHLHYNVGPDNARYLCLKHMKDQDCPICEAQLQAADKEESDQLRASKAALCWIIDRDNEKAGPQLWTIPFSKVRNEIHARSVDKKSRAPILVDDPEEGFDIVFNREGTGKTTNYTAVEVLREASPLHDDPRTQQRWLDYIQEHPLPEVLNYYDAAHLLKVLHGKAEPTEETVDDDGVVTETAPRRTARRAAAAEEAPADEAPARRGNGRQATTEATEVEAQPTSSRRRALLDQDDEVPFEEGEADAPETPRSRVSRPLEAETPVASARRSLERLKPSSRRP